MRTFAMSNQRADTPEFSMSNSRHRREDNLMPLTAGVFLFLTLTTEWLYIEVGPGALRPYHFTLIPLLILFLYRIFRLPILSPFGALLGFSTSTALSIILAADVASAAASGVLLFLNMSIGIVFAALLTSDSRLIYRFKPTLIKITFFTITVAMIQFCVMRITGFPLGGSESQVDQIIRGFAPSLFTEANSYAKFLLTPFLFLIPFFIRGLIGNRERILVAFIALAFFINLMRTVLVALLLTAVVMFFWYARRGFLIKFGNRLFILFFFTAILTFAMTFSGVTAEYSDYKINSLTSFEALSEDQSLGYRLLSMSLAIEQALASTKSIFLGLGWGQANAYLTGEVRQLGGADIVNVFAYNGLFGLLSYVVLLISALRSAVNLAGVAVIIEEKAIAEGVLFALIGNIFQGLVSGMLIWPSFWLLVGITIFFTVAARRYRFKCLRKVMK